MADKVIKVTFTDEQWKQLRKARKSEGDLDDSLREWVEQFCLDAVRDSIATMLTVTMNEAENIRRRELSLEMTEVWPDPQPELPPPPEDEETPE